MCKVIIVLMCFFFFQAEDGVRDRTVTGVQTCALPISPSRRGEVTRRYRGDTLILETEWRTAGGAVRLTDFMPPRAGQAPVLVRIVEGLEGAVEMECVFRLRFGYGKV